jgi:hypothetical protein
MKQIPLLYGRRHSSVQIMETKFALVDDADYEELMKYKWSARQEPGSHLWYAIRRERKPRSARERDTRKVIIMHRVIMNAPPFVEVDHRDHNGLNNVRSNLRLCDRSQNMSNMSIRKHSSIYKGVTWRKDRLKWAATITKNRKHNCLGHYVNEIDAARAYNVAAQKLFGEFAFLNSIPSCVIVSVAGPLS